MHTANHLGLSTFVFVSLSHSDFFFLLIWFELLHYVRCIFIGGLIWLGSYRTYWRDKVAVATLLFRPGMCSGGRTQALTVPVDPGGRIHRQNTVHRYSTTRRAQATASPITELLVGQSSSKCCSSTSSASFQSSLVTRELVPRKVEKKGIIRICLLMFRKIFHEYCLEFDTLKIWLAIKANNL